MVKNLFFAVTNPKKRLIVFSNAKVKSLDEWLTKNFMGTLGHELIHVMHRADQQITKLIQACRILEGWNMEGSQLTGKQDDYDESEHLAYVGEHFFQRPQNRSLYPNTYRLLYTLIKKQEAGLPRKEWFPAVKARSPMPQAPRPLLKRSLPSLPVIPKMAPMGMMPMFRKI